MKIWRYVIIAAIVILAIFVISLAFTPKIDYMKRSVAIENSVNQALVEMKLGESNLLEIYNEQKSRGKAKWIYFTKKFQVDKDFSFENAQKSIAAKIKPENGKIAFSKTMSKGEKFILVIGTGSVITHNLIFEKKITTTPVVARVAIIIDDFGFNGPSMHDFVKIDYPLTFAVLPYLKYSKEASELGHRSGKEIMYHLPLQGTRVELNVNVITITMTKEEIQKKFEEGLKWIPYAVGVNNHMGSMVTENTEEMKIILGKIKEKGFFFVDSYTSEKSVAKKVAREMSIKTGKRSVFLDMENFKDVAYIKKQIEKLVSVAKKNGEAIGIGHNRIWTAQALAEELPKFKDEGVQLIFASQIVK